MRHHGLRAGGGVTWFWNSTLISGSPTPNLCLRAKATIATNSTTLYGSRDMMLIGLALSADSDDTETRIEAGIRDPRLSGYP
jgi:hypothetical protein